MFVVKSPVKSGKLKRIHGECMTRERGKVDLSVFQPCFALFARDARDKEPNIIVIVEARCIVTL